MKRISQKGRRLT